MNKSIIGAIRTLFGSREFTLAEFKATMALPDPESALSILKGEGKIVRLCRGVYRLATDDERDAVRRMRWRLAEEKILKSGLPFALADVTALSVWTRGGYVTGFSAAYYPYHIAVPAKSLGDWKAFLEGEGIRYAISGDERRFRGFFAVLHRVEKLEFEKIDGLLVITKNALLEFVRREGIEENEVVRWLSSRKGWKGAKGKC